MSQLGDIQKQRRTFLLGWAMPPLRPISKNTELFLYDSLVLLKKNLAKKHAICSVFFSDHKLHVQ
jgi:hypothetical protein